LAFEVSDPSIVNEIHAIYFIVAVQIFSGGQTIKTRILLIVVSLLSTAGASQAEGGKLGVTSNVQYRSKWLSKGAEVYGQQGAVFEAVEFDFYDTGFGLRVTHRDITSSGYVDSQRFDYRPYYKSVLAEDWGLLPGIYHQVSMDDSVNTRKDITYCIIHVRHRF